jgi:hypothetical protein
LDWENVIWGITRQAKTKMPVNSSRYDLVCIIGTYMKNEAITIPLRHAIIMPSRSKEARFSHISHGSINLGSVSKSNAVDKSLEKISYCPYQFYDTNFETDFVFSSQSHDF